MMMASSAEKSLDSHPKSGSSSSVATVGVAKLPMPCDEPSCTERCRSKEHGLKIWDIALGGNTADAGVVCMWAKTCMNYAMVKDEFGRTALHAAASTGNLKAVEWLIKTQQCNINAKDFISGYTPLHRSIYFGHFHVARSLIKHGADVNMRDNEGLTPFELCQKDRPKLFGQNRGDMTELTVWGSNANYNLGLGHQQPRLLPDVVPEFRRPEMSLAKVEMNTYHTVFLTQTGKAYACGYGMGGRLGTGDDEVVLNPSLVSLRNNGPCRDIAVGQDHTIFLTDTKVWTVGSNEFGQLGHQGLPNPFLKNPRTVDSLQRQSINGIFAGNHHSGFFNSVAVLMCGLNQGQFGRGFEEQAVVPSPSKLRLSLDNVGNGSVTSVGGNDFSTAVCIERRYVFLLRRHQCIRIDSRNTTSHEISKIQASGDKNNIALFMLTSSGRILVWRENLQRSSNENRGAFTRIVFSGSRYLDIKDFSVSLSALVVITNTGEAYKAGWNCTNTPTIVGKIEEKFGQVAAADFQIASRQRRGRKEDEAPLLALESIRVKRVPNVYTGLSVSSDVKGNNFSILQRHPMMDVTDIPWITETHMIKDIRTLYEESDVNDNICDVTFEIDSFNKFGAHRLILASISPVFASVFEKHLHTNVIKVSNKLFSIDPTKCATLEDPKTFRAVLDMAYTRECYCTNVNFLITCYNISKEEGKKKGKYADKVKELSRFKSLCRVLGMFDCESLISRYMNDLEHQVNTNPDGEALDHFFKLNQYYSDTAEVTFTLEAREMFSDAVLESSDKIDFEANKCVLVARLEYFKSFFSINWQDVTISNGSTRTSKPKILLPFSSKAMSILLEWIYTNTAPSLKEADIDLVCETLGCADYVMSDNLLQICETEMAGRINLKNVVDILIFAWKHNGTMLKNTCFDLISLSLTAMLENRLLDPLPAELVVELNEYYRKNQQCHLSIYRDLEGGQLPSFDEYEVAVKETSEDILENLQMIEDADQATTLLKKNQNKGGRSRVRLRSRTYSESESPSEQKEQLRENRGEVPVNLPVGELLNPGTGITQSNCHPVAGPSTSVAATSFSTSRRNDSPTDTKVEGPQRHKLIVPLPQNSVMPFVKVPEKKTSLQSEEFPSLGSVALPASISKNHLPKQKFGQDIVTPQASTSSQASTTAAVSTAGGKKKTKWRTIKSESDIKMATTPPIIIGSEMASGGTSGANLTADGRDRNNPWKTISTPQESEVAFQAIVEDEKEKKRNLQNAISKPFYMMQIEDEVIDFLTARYSSEDTHDFIELLTVERQGSSNFSVPTWVQHPGAVSASFPSQSPASPT